MEKNTEKDISKEMTPMEAAFNMIEQENQELKDNIKELEIRIQKISQESQTYAQKCLQEIHCRHESEKELSKALTKQNETISTLENELTTKAEEEKLLRKRLESEKETVRNLQMELDNINKKKVRRVAAVVLLFILACLPYVYFCMQVEKYKSENRSLYQQAVGLRAETNLLSYNMDILQDDFDLLKEENAALKEDIASLEQQKDSLESGNSDIREEYSSLSDEFQLLQTDYEKIQPEYDFYHGKAVIVYDDNTKRYHQYGCSKGEGKSFWIYDKEQAKELGYTPCSTCLPGLIRIPIGSSFDFGQFLN